MARGSAAAARWLAPGCRLLTILIFAYAAWAKLSDPAGFRRAVAGYGIGAIPDSAVTLFPWLELAFAVVLTLSLVWELRWLTNGLLLGAVALYVGFGGLMGWALAHGLGTGGCGCFGGNDPLTGWDIVRDGIFALLALGGWVRGPCPDTDGDQDGISEAAPLR